MVKYNGEYNQYFCDCCGKEVDNLYESETNEQLCEDCLLENQDPVTCSECGYHEELYYSGGKFICAYCLLSKAELSCPEENDYENEPDFIAVG